jgi:hypothetical protein
MGWAAVINALLEYCLSIISRLTFVFIRVAAWLLLLSHKKLL